MRVIKLKAADIVGWAQARIFFARVLLLTMLASSSPVHAALVQTSINIDGNTSDWAAVLASSAQVASDGDGRSCPSSDLDTGSPCSKLTPGGRDLKTFAYTWDSTYLYIYVARWDTSNNVTDWWFYLDTNNDGKLQTGEYIFRVSWQGNNQSTDTVLYSYIQSAAGGDPLVDTGGNGDGYTMPGSLGTSKALESLTGGESDQSAMESRLAWAEITASTPPISIGFHIAASNGTNLPSSVIDNMDGPGGGGGSLAFPDLSVTKTVDRNPVWANNDFTYTVTVTNNGDADATGVTLTDLIPSGLTYVSHVVSQGTYNSGSGLWDIGSIPYTTPTLTSVTLALTVKGNDVMSPSLITNTANSLTLNEADPDSSNNSASVDVTVNPRPVLTLLKSANKATSKPGEIVTYSITVTNTGNGVAGLDSTVITDLLSPYLAFGVDAMGGNPFQITDPASCGIASGLTLGTPTYSNLTDTPRTFGYSPAASGYDGNVTAWKLPFTGNFAAGGCFTLQYKAQMK